MIVFLEKSTWQFMQNVSSEHEMSNSVFWENNDNNTIFLGYVRELNLESIYVCHS